MRVIAGNFRSRVLLEVGEESTRETKDRVKESVFNSISRHLYDADVLDLFGGSGSLGIEAISRGSKSCDFVDSSRMACRTMKENIKNLAIEDQTSVFEQNYKSYLLTCSKQFDIILLDPPYSLESLNEIIDLIGKNKLLTDNGVVVCFYSKNYCIKENKHGLSEYKQKKIGITKVSYFNWNK